MKKALAIGLSCFMALSASVPVIAAEIQPQTCGIGHCNMGECFLDADGDGYCDNYGHCFVDDNGDGVCDNHCYWDDDEDGICDYFIDDDEDGICDHCHEHGKPAQTTTYCAPQATQGRSHHGGHHGRGHHGGHC